MRTPGTGVKLLLAVSGDGFLARGPKDDMSWTGFTDKQVFRLLTLSHPILLAGRTTAEQLPRLPGRRVVTLSRSASKGMRLEQAVEQFPGSWLIGGAHVAAAALAANLVEATYLCRTDKVLGGGISSNVLLGLLKPTPNHVVLLDSTCNVEVYHHHGA